MPAPSPLLLINGSPQLNGVAVSPGSTVSVALASSFGVSSWTLTCTGTDDLNAAATINASIVVNTSTFTATYTHPSTNGSKVILQSTINNGVDINGRPLASYSTTAAAYSLANSGYAVGAQNETIETNASFGWLPIVNNLARNAPSGPIGPGPTGTHIGSAGFTYQAGTTGFTGPSQLSFCITDSQAIYFDSNLLVSGQSGAQGVFFGVYGPANTTISYSAVGNASGPFSLCSERVLSNSDSSIPGFGTSAQTVQSYCAKATGSVRLTGMITGNGPGVSGTVQLMMRVPSGSAALASRATLMTLPSS